MKMKVSIAVLVFFLIASVVGARGTYDPIKLHSINGAVVEIVAVHSISAEGVTYSPKPSSPLIGSNTLAVITTDWQLINSESLQAYPEILRARRKAENGTPVNLNVGPHFTDITTIIAEIKSNIPRITIVYADGRSVTLPLTTFLSNQNYTTARRWQINDRDKEALALRWDAISKRIEPIAYRPEISRLQFDIARAVRSVRSIDSQSGVFNITHANNIKALLAVDDSR